MTKEQDTRNDVAQKRQIFRRAVSITDVFFQQDNKTNTRGDNHLPTKRKKVQKIESRSCHEGS